MATTSTETLCQCHLPGGLILTNRKCAYCNPSTAAPNFNRPRKIVPDPEPETDPPPRKGFRQKKRGPRQEPPPSFTERLVAKLDERLSPEKVRQARQFTRRRRAHRVQKRT